MSKIIQLSGDKSSIVDDEDFDWLSEFKWSFNGGYAARTQSVKKREAVSSKEAKTLYMHKEILKHYGLFSEYGDHKNKDKLDNRKDNLREANNQQNCCNSSKQKGNCKSRYKGVTWYQNRNKWRARITNKGKCILLGFYDSEVDAALAYDVGSLYYHGEFGSLNFPKEIRKDHIKVLGINYDYWEELKQLKTSEYTGIRRDTRYENKFYAEIFINGKNIYLGAFDSEEEAVKYRNQYIIKNKLKKKFNLLSK